MSALQCCLACQHESPATAKFCSECGGQLNLNFGTQFAVTRKPSEARPMRTSRTLVGVVALAMMAGLAFYLYRQPSLNPNVMHSVRNAGAAAPEISPANTAASMVPISTSQHGVTRPNPIAKPSRAPSFNKKQSAAVTPAGSAVRTPPEMAGTIASDVPPPNVKDPAAGTEAAAGDTSSAKSTKPPAAEAKVGGSQYPASPNDFHFIAPPP